MTVPKPIFRVSHEPAFTTVEVRGGFPTKDDLDPNIVHLFLWSSKNEPIELPQEVPSDFARPYEVELELVMTWRALAQIDIEFQLLFDAYLPKGREREIRRLLKEKPEVMDWIPLIQYSANFRRVFTNGSTAHPVDERIRLGFWNRKLRLESSEQPVIISFIDAEAIIGWSEATYLWREIHEWGKSHWSHWSNLWQLWHELRSGDEGWMTPQLRREAHR